MKEIQHNKFSLFRLEKVVQKHIPLVEKCFEYIDTYNTLEEAQSAQKEFKNKSIILPSY